MNVIAHRGFSSRAPENTLAAFRQAIAFGCDWIELDVQLTADQIPVVIHDHTIDRCSNGRGNVFELTLATLQQYDAGSWFSKQYTGEKIPTFEETVRLAKHSETKLNVELKPAPQTNEHVLCQQVATILRRHHIQSTEILFSSFSISALRAIQLEMPDMPRGLLWETMPDHAFDLLAELDAVSVHCDYNQLTEIQARAIKANGYRIYCYTPNDPQQVRHYWDWGVDNMISDTPDRYR